LSSSSSFCPNLKQEVFHSWNTHQSLLLSFKKNGFMDMIRSLCPSRNWSITPFWECFWAPPKPLVLQSLCFSLLNWLVDHLVSSECRYFQMMLKGHCMTNMERQAWRELQVVVELVPMRWAASDPSSGSFWSFF
jgi:hypothetical protein